MTVIRPKIRRPSGDWPMPARTWSWAGIVVMSRPSNSIRPALGRSSPWIVRSVVVLPAPLAPSRVTISPSKTSSEMPCSAWMLP